MSEVDNAPRTYAERYVLSKRLAAGAATEVWLAHDDIVGRPVALKIWFGRAATDPLWRKAFSRDATGLEALAHPGLAKLHEHGASDTETWVAMTATAGTPLAELQAPLSSADALSALGQAALAIQTAHDAGITHGAVSAAHLLWRAEGVVSVVGFALGSASTRAADLAALAALAREQLAADRVPDGPPAAVASFVDWAGGRSGVPPRDAADLGRTALALAATLSGDDADRDAGRVRVEVTSRADLRRSEGPTTAAGALRDTPPYTSPDSPPDSLPETPGGDEDESRWSVSERRRVRNRLLALGAIVVIGGAALLRIVGGGDGQVTVPREIGFPIAQAQLTLTSAGLRGLPQYQVGATDSGGTVIAQSPRPGEQVKAGSTVTLTVSEGS